MQTVQLQCGSCSNMMAISVEHLGAQVQCPHCAAVVQTPPRSALGPPPGPDPQGAAVQPPMPQYQPPAYQPPPPPERESIFSEPEPSDDLFGGDNSPRVQMPEPSHGHAAQQSATAVAEDEEEQVDLRAMRGRLEQHRKASNFAPMVLVFLVPYAICTTAFIAYLLLTWPKLEAYKWLPDPTKVKTSQLELPVHDLPVPASLKTTLNKPITVGQMEITPLRVVRNAGGDLTLVFKAKNLSDKLTIRPIDQAFFDRPKAPPGKLAPPSRSYTFLERLGAKDASKESERVYNGELEAVKDLAPGQECVVELSTENGEKVRNVVKTILANDGYCQWRIQVRRGNHVIHGHDMPLTAIVGVEFSAKEVTNAG